MAYGIPCCNAIEDPPDMHFQQGLERARQSGSGCAQRHITRVRALLVSGDRRFLTDGRDALLPPGASQLGASTKCEAPFFFKSSKGKGPQGWHAGGPSQSVRWDRHAREKWE